MKLTDVESVNFRDIEDHFEEYTKDFWMKYPLAKKWDYISHFELDSCPFCGGEGNLVSNDMLGHGMILYEQFYGLCYHCQSRGPICRDLKEAAIKWNTRSDYILIKKRDDNNGN